MSSLSRNTVTRAFSIRSFALWLLSVSKSMLYKFSSKTIEGVQFMNKDILLHAFDQLRSHFRYVGILTIVMLGLYVLIIFFAVIAGIAMAL